MTEALIIILLLALAVVVSYLIVCLPGLLNEIVEQYERDQFRKAFKNRPNFAMLFKEEIEGMSEEEIDRKLGQMIDEQTKNYLHLRNKVEELENN